MAVVGRPALRADADSERWRRERIHPGRLAGRAAEASGCALNVRTGLSEIGGQSPPGSGRPGAEQFFSEATMTVQTIFEDGAVRREAPAWGAVFALTLC